MNSYSDILSTETEQTVSIDSNFNILCFPGPVKTLLKTFFDDNLDIQKGKLPYAIHSWMITEVQRAGSKTQHLSIKAVTTFTRHGRILVALLLKPTQSLDYKLFLEEDQSAFREYKGIARQLTRRQLEMYHLLKDGEKNITTIARKMGISTRTAEGHKMNLRRIVSDL